MKALIVGDMHGSSRAAVALKGLLEEHDPDVVLQLGDFGWWPSSGPFLEHLNANLKRHDATLYWVDGNHEHHPSLKQDQEVHPIGGFSRIFHMSRGSHVKLGDTIVVGLGGAVSIDRGHRILGYSWFQEEEISAFQAKQIFTALGGLPQGERIVIAHDSPEEEVPFIGLPWVPDDLQRASLSHRKLLGAMRDVIQPAAWYHGHWHEAESYGQVHGLAHLDGRLPQKAWAVREL